MYKKSIKEDEIFFCVRHAVYHTYTLKQTLFVNFQLRNLIGIEIKHPPHPTTIAIYCPAASLNIPCHNISEISFEEYY